MPLTHVKKWTPEGKWKSVTIEEMRRDNQSARISARSGLLMCDLCNKFVIMTEANIRDSYFKHSNADEDKACPERSGLYGTPAYRILDEKTKGLPIRIVVDQVGNSRFEIGFPAIHDSDIKAKGNIRISSIQGTYAYSVERLSSHGSSYLNVGNLPAPEYKIQVNGIKGDITKYWPSRIQGIQNNTLFRKTTGTLLQKDSDIVKDEEYYLLSRSWLYSTPYIELKKIGSNGSYKLYTIKIIDLSDAAARFVLGDLQYRLVGTQMKMTFLWPVIIKDPYLIYHSKKIQYVFITGEAQYRMYPNNEIKCSSSEAGTLLKLTCYDRQQLLSIGRYRNILDYTYLWKSDFKIEKKYELPDDKAPLETSTRVQFTRGTIISFKPSFNGKLIVEESGWVISQYELKAGEYFELTRIRKTNEFSIYYGLDCVWTTKRNSADEAIKEDTYLTDGELLGMLTKCRGMLVPVNDAIKNAAVELAEYYPLTTIWLSRRIHNGKIEIDAYQFSLLTK